MNHNNELNTQKKNLAQKITKYQFSLIQLNLFIIISNQLLAKKKYFSKLINKKILI